MIRLTLEDGTRAQLAASDIETVEPLAKGALVVKTSGETLSVLQDYRTVSARVAAALATVAREDIVAESPIPEEVLAEEAIVEEAAPPRPVAEARPCETPQHRRKRALLGRVSLSAFVIGGYRAQGPRAAAGVARSR